MGRAGRVNVKRKAVEITSSQPRAAAQTNGCARETQKLKQNVLDGADFVRDVRNTYLVFNVRLGRRSQWVDATLDRSLLPEAQQLEVVREP
jgi:hypothetical protein